jgi:hypothetical protein
MARIIAAEFEATGRRDTSRFHTLEDGSTEHGLGGAVGFGVGFGVAGRGVAVLWPESEAPGEALGASVATAISPELASGDETPDASPDGAIAPGVEPEPLVPGPGPVRSVQAATAVISTSEPAPAIATDGRRSKRMRGSYAVPALLREADRPCRSSLPYEAIPTPMESRAANPVGARLLAADN